MTTTMEFQGSSFKVEDSANPGTFLAIPQVTNWDTSGGEAPQIDISHHQSVAREYRLGLPDYGEITFTTQYDANNATVDEIRSMYEARQQTKFEVEYNAGNLVSEPKEEFDGYVQGFQKSGSVDNIWTAEITIKITGAITFTPGADA